MKQSTNKRLTALEQAQQSSGPRFPDSTPALLLVYGTDEECAQWEAAGRPAATRAEWEAALNLVYGDR